VGKGDNLNLKSIESIASYLIDYVNGEQAPVFAIGTKAKHPKLFTGDAVQQCFPINGDIQSPFMNGIESIKS
jgi:hypothetical protein